MKWPAGMARSRRLGAAGILRHVMARGNGRMRIFLDQIDYTKFVQILGDVLEELDIECWNYCVMPNHYHAALRPTRPNLSEAMRRINSIYAQWWNRRHARVGHVFQGRYKEQLVQRDGYALVLCRYVAMNPVRAGLTKRPEDWRWSSYAATIGLTSPAPFLAVNSVLAQFGVEEPEVLYRRLIDYVTGGSDDDSTFERIRSSECILGNNAFKAAVRKLIDTSSDTPPEGGGATPDSAVDV